MVEAVKVGQQRSELNEINPGMERKTTLSVAVGTMPDFVNPTSSICAGCSKSAMYTVERNGNPYCEECLPTPGGLPKEDAEWIKTGKPATDKTLTYDDYKRIKTDYPDKILMLHVGAMWTTWDDDVKELRWALDYGSRLSDRKKVKAIEGVDSAKRPMASFNERNIDILEEIVCEGARETLVFVNKEGEVRVREPRSIAQLNQEIREIETRAEEAREKINETLKQIDPDMATSFDVAIDATKVLEEGIIKLTEFIDAKKAETASEIAPQSSQNVSSTPNEVDE
jgi:hypothetical protein